MSDLTCILSQIESGDPSAAEQLLPLVYNELRRLAGAKLAHEKPGQTLQATALVHEAYIRLVDADGEPIALTPGNTWIELAENTGDDAFTGPPVDLSAIEEGEAPPTTIEYPRIVLDEPELAPTEILIAFTSPSDQAGADDTTPDDG